jgi:hypothetical protein
MLAVGLVNQVGVERYAAPVAIASGPSEIA